MTKKNLKPQQAAPVQREINTTSSVGGTGLTPQNIAYSIIGAILGHKTPFADGRQSSPLDSNTNLKKCQKSFSTCHGARFASMN